MKKCIFIFVITAAFPITIFCAQDAPINITADALEYDMEREIVVARGSVTVSYRYLKISGDHIKISVKTRTIHASGDVILERADSKIRFSSGTYRMADDELYSYYTTGVFGPWLFNADKTFSEKNKHTGHGASITTCYLCEPHYKVGASRITVIPGERITVHGAVFYIGRLPVFYLPVWWRDLREVRHRIEIHPGHNSRDGVTIRGIVSYRFTDFFVARGILDLFYNRDPGKGVELNYYRPAKTRSTAYLYHIRDNITRTNRWRFESHLWHRFSELWSAHSELNYIGEVGFNQPRLTERWNYVEGRINSNIFFNRQSPLSNLRIGVTRRDVYNQSKREYERTYIAAPLIEYTRYRNRTFLGFYPELTASYRNVSEAVGAPFLSHYSGRFQMTRAQRILRNLSLTPAFGITSDLSENTPGKYTFLSRYLMGLGLRYSPVGWADFDLQYSYRHRTSTNSLSPCEKGVEKNFIGASLHLRPIPVLHWSASSGYDFLTRLEQPLLNRLSINYKRNSLHLNYMQRLRPFAYGSMQLFYSHGDIFSLNVAHNNAVPDDFGIGARVKFNIGRDTELIYSINGLYSKGVYEPKTQQLTLNQDLHCWFARVQFRSSPGMDEFFVTLSLKTEGFAVPTQMLSDNCSCRDCSASR